MPAPEGRHRYQAALLWMQTGVDDLGQYMVASVPVQIRVRWNTNRVEAKDSKGNTVTLDGTAITDRDIAIGSRMALGTLACWNEAGSAEEDTELMEVVVFNATPDIRNRAQMRTAGLMRFRNP